MAFEGGIIGTLGITPAFITGLATTSAQNGTIQGIGQVWQGAGQSYFGSAGQALAGNLAGSAINIGLNAALGTQVVGPQGIPLTSGANILASTITPFVTSSVAAGINQNLQQSLQVDLQGAPETSGEDGRGGRIDDRGSNRWIPAGGLVATAARRAPQRTPSAKPPRSSPSCISTRTPA
jgi:hypothetical protein